MLIEVASDDARSADAFLEECLIHLARCGIAAERVPGHARIDLPRYPGPLFRVDIRRESGADEVTNMSSLLQHLVEAGVVDASAASVEQLLMTRLADLGYL